MDAPNRFSAMIYKGDNFCDFLFAFLFSKNPFEKLKREELASKVLLSRLPLQEGVKTVLIELPNLKVYPFFLRVVSSLRRGTATFV